MDITLLPSPPATPPLCENKNDNVSIFKFRNFVIFFKILLNL